MPVRGTGALCTFADVRRRRQRLRWSQKNKKKKRGESQGKPEHVLDLPIYFNSDNNPPLSLYLMKTMEPIT